MFGWLTYLKVGLFALAILGAWLFHWSAVSQARQEERAACEQQKAASIRDADQIDAGSLYRQIDSLQEQLRVANQRAFAAEQDRKEQADEIAVLPLDVRTCRQPNDTDWRRLQ